MLDFDLNSQVSDTQYFGLESQDKLRESPANSEDCELLQGRGDSHSQREFPLEVLSSVRERLSKLEQENAHLRTMLDDIRKRANSQERRLALLERCQAPTALGATRKSSDDIQQPTADINRHWYPVDNALLSDHAPSDLTLDPDEESQVYISRRALTLRTHSSHVEDDFEENGDESDSGISSNAEPHPYSYPA
ncbi:hypothetical protein BD626DRAFT_129074 [Schizophyllum amplum]|uniref:Uncharacterized protein n=1 Tax=Schizophyllum amplum TaxID=97359 RepID=A0A550BRU7_9AGAR|nr:hypothetical protein BD626DRAFT_129074 [Auriculariopsis ampla]